jgi:hypothetical protein
LGAGNQKWAALVASMWRGLAICKETSKVTDKAGRAFLDTVNLTLYKTVLRTMNIKIQATTCTSRFRLAAIAGVIVSCAITSIRGPSAVGVSAYSVVPVTKQHQDCDLWAETDGECVNNPAFMWSACHSSCMTIAKDSDVDQCQECMSYRFCYVELSFVLPK